MSPFAPAVQQNSPSTGSCLQVLRTTAGWASLTDTGWIAVTGADRVRWLNGMVTNSVQALTPGEGAYSFLLNAQGRIQGDGIIWCEPERLLIETSASQVGPMMALLDRFIIMDEVELQDATGEWHGLEVAGPRAAELLTQIGIVARTSRLLKRIASTWRSHDIRLISTHSPLLPRLEIWSADAEMIHVLGEALTEAGSASCSSEDFEQLRMLEGTPRFGIDIRDRDLPQETAQTRALHFNKGCYLGQEIVERIRSRGRVHRTFTRFRLHGTVPAAVAELLAEDKPVGVLTSISPQPIDGATLALGYIRQEALERALPLTYAGGTAEALTSQDASNPETDR